MKLNEYPTSDYGLANWLVFNGVELLGTVELPNETRKSFVFLSDDRVEDLINDWNRPVSEQADICRRFFKAHTYIKRNLRESLRVSDVARPSNNN